MKKRVEVSIKMLQVRIYGEHPDNYESVFDIYVDGIKGFIFSLIGKGFYSSVDDVVAALEKFGIKEFHGSVMPAHGAAIQKLLGKKYDVQFPEQTECAGRVMYFAKIKRKDSV